jgi:D-Tyr-tRNAtyr deacylase
MEISRNLNCKQNKKEIDRLERKLDKLKLIANETDEINAQIKQLEGLIKNYYNKKTEAAKIRSRVKWAEEGEKSTRYFFNLEKSEVKKSYGI